MYILTKVYPVAKLSQAGLYSKPTASLERGTTPPTRYRHMTLKHLKVRLQSWCSR